MNLTMASRLVGGLILAGCLGIGATAGAGCLPDGEVVSRVVIPFRAGNITRIVMTEKSVSWIDLDPVLLAGKFAPGETVPSALIQRSPDEGTIFVVLMVELAPKHSLGRYDYTLDVGRDSAECQAIARRDDPFARRRHEVEESGSGGTVQMLYQIKCPSRSTSGSLTPKLKRTLHEQDVEIPLELPAPKPPKETAAAPAEGAGAETPPAAAGEPAAPTPAEAGKPPAEAAPAAGTPTAKPAEEPKKPGEKPAEKPAEKPVEKPGPKPAEAPVKPAPAKPAEPPAKPAGGGSLWD